MIDLDAALSRVPDYERFLSLDEMYARARAVAEAHPDLVEHRIVGSSTDGGDIPMVRIGDGNDHLLLYASPHPNEPIGAMLVQFLLEELVVNERLREGRSWFLLPCVDPDGTRLNEGWFAGPYTVRDYAANFYRPRSEEQVEWTFPIRYKDLDFQAPMPETRSLMRAFEIADPRFVYSLHNAGFGGVYYYISHDIRDAYDDFYRIPTERGLTLSLGEPEMPWAVEFAPAVYKMISIRDAYDYFDTYGTGSPAALIHGGASSYDHLSSRGAPVMLITELPYFQSPQVSDTTPTERTRREIILAGIGQTREMMAALRVLLERIAPEMGSDTRFYRTVVSFVDQATNNLESKRTWAESAEGMGAPATVAQEVDELYVGPFYQLLNASMLRRALDEQLSVTPSDNLRHARNDLEGMLEAWTDRIETGLEYSAIPIRKLVEVQYGALLSLLNSEEFAGTLAKG